MNATAPGPGLAANPAMDPDVATTEGTLLGGRVAYRQFRTGHRTGIEPVLLAAAVPALPGERVAEGGTGAGAGLLCLASRVPGLAGIGLEANPALVALARRNLAANPGGGGTSLVIRHATIPALDAPLGTLDHAFANPPWFDPGATPSPDAARRLARVADPSLLHGWAGCLASPLRRGGTLTLVVPAALALSAADAVAASGCGGIVLFPLWPRAGRAAKIAILQGTRHSRAPFRLAAGLALHCDDSGYTAEADAILRDGRALALV